MHLPVILLKSSSAAICLFGRPVTTSANTSRSRTDREAKRAFSSATAPSWRRTRSRSTATWIASSSSCSRRGFVRNSTAPQLHCPHGHGSVAVPADEYDRKPHARLGYPALELEFRSALAAGRRARCTPARPAAGSAEIPEIDPNVCTSSPTEVNRSSTASRTDTSSSMTYTTERSVAVGAHATPECWRTPGNCRTQNLSAYIAGDGRFASSAGPQHSRSAL